MVDEFRELRDRIIERCFCSLNDEQLSAVLSDRDKVLVAACPGAGKTQVIINRILYLKTFGATYRNGNVPDGLTREDISQLRDFLEREDAGFAGVPEVLTREAVPEENMVVITFTRMAAKGMEDRYRKASGSCKGPFFGTFHSLFYRILEKRKARPALVSEGAVKDLIRGVLERYTDSVTEDKVMGVLNDIARHKNSSAEAQPPGPETDAGIFGECLALYEGFKAERGLMDFDDITLECISLLREDEGLLKRYRSLFRHVLVDEFQDCDSQQILFLKLLGKGSRLFAVGDEDQCIYGFRGSRPDCMVDFCSHFEDGEKYFLNRNYRSRSCIIDSAKRLISFNSCRNEKKMRAVREGDGSLTLMPCKSPMEQAEKAAEILAGLGCRTGQCDAAVLYRTNRECGLLTAALLRRGIRFRLIDGAYSFLEEELCRDMLAYFRLAVDPFDRESLIRILNKPNRFIGRTLTEKVRHWATERNVFSLMAELRGMGLSQVKGVLRLERQVSRLGRMKPDKAVGYVLGKIGYIEHLEKNEQLKPALEEFEALAATFKSVRELLAFSDLCCREMGKAVENQGGVVLSTIHGAKGLEYENVIIINCSEGNIPHRNSQGSTEEERRIFYVGVTRAEDSLWLMWPEAVGGKICRESLFIEELL